MYWDFTSILKPPGFITCSFIQVWTTVYIKLYQWLQTKVFIFIFIKHTHSYQSAAPWKSCCCLQAVSGLQTSPALSGRRRYENVWQHLYKYSFLDCGCKETKHMYLHKSNTYCIWGQQTWYIRKVIYNFYILNNINTVCFIHTVQTFC